MQRTLKLAAKGRGRVSPNPMVGALVVKDQKIIARGYHSYFGGPHAEVVAFSNSRAGVRGGTLYVNLEPCSHYGKQPPCSERIVEVGIKRVVIGTLDPNPLVNGKGIRYLREQGIEVETGVLEERCQELNRSFFKHVATGQPFVTLKIAQTIDGKIAARNGQPEWITSSASLKVVHKMRAENDAVLVGIGTVLADDPQLTVRLVRGQNPKRIVVDSQLRIPLESTLLTDEFVSKTIVATTELPSKEKAKHIEQRGASVWRVQKNAAGRVDLEALLTKIGQEGITSLLVEGGSEIYSSFLKAKLVDRVAIFIAPKILGEGVSAIQDLGISSVANSLLLRDFQKKRVGPDILLTGNLLLS